MKVAVIGLGIMGRAITAKLLESGHQVIVWNRTASVADELVSLGAALAETPADAASQADVVMSIVTNPDAVSDVTLAPDGIFEGLRDSSVHAEMSTVSPDWAKKLAGIYAESGKRFVQAPVFGSRVQIEQKQLLVAAGGAPEDIEQCRSAWLAFAKMIWTAPSPQGASALKLGVNMLLAQMILALGQSLAFAKAFDVEPSMLLEVVMQSALGSAQYQSKGAAILRGDYTPNFTVASLFKDITLAKESVTDKHGTFDLNDTAYMFLNQAIVDGYGHEDYSAVVKTVAKKAGVKL